MTWKALVVEIIRLIWDKGLHRDNATLKQIHEEWFSFWVDWRTALTMKDVDRQIEELREESIVDGPTFTETAEGETLLGGNLELRAPWLDEDDNS